MTALPSSATAEAELERLRGLTRAQRLEERALDMRDPSRLEHHLRLQTQRMRLYRDALRVIASGELTRNKAVQAALRALEQGDLYRLAGE